MDRLVRYIKERNYQTVFAAVLFIGICIHGGRIFTAYYAHDDAEVMSGVGVTYVSGRWGLQVLYKLQMLIIGSSVNAKGFLGMALLVLLAIACCVMAGGLGIKSRRGLLLLSGVVVTFPYVPSILCYTYAAPHYCLSIILSLAAAVLMQSGDDLKQKILRSAAGVFCLGGAMAIYQAALCVFIAYLALLAVRHSLDVEGTESWKHYIARCTRYLLGCVAGCALYSVSNKLILQLKGFSMSGHQNLDKMGDITPRQFLSRAALAYREFFSPASDQSYSFYLQTSIRWYYGAVLIVLGVCGAVVLVREIRGGNVGKAVQLLLLFGILPLAFNSVFLTADADTTHIYSLMMFQEVMVYVCCIFALEKIRRGVGAGVRGKLCRAGYYAGFVSLCCVMAYFSYIANVCYKKAAIQQEQAIAYFNRLITRMQMTEGYSTDMPVAYVYEYNKTIEHQKIQYINDNGYSIAAYDYVSLVNMYNWRNYMEMWCGFRAPEVPYEALTGYFDMPEVRDMPIYPDAGSVKVIDGVLVVKFTPY